MPLWTARFLDLATHTATWSKDPRRKIGCVIIGDQKNQLAGGFNGFPREVKDDDRLFNKEIKNKLIVHAEANAVADAARNGHALKGSTAYISQLPCSQCAALLIQAGITTVVATLMWAEYTPPTRQEWFLALELFKEVGMIVYYELPGGVYRLLQSEEQV